MLVFVHGIVRETCRLIHSTSASLPCNDPCCTPVLTIADVIVSFRLNLRTQLRCHSRSYTHVLSPLRLKPALLRLGAGHAPTPYAPLAAIALPSHAHPAVSPTRRSRAHRRILALEAFPPPGIGEAEGFEFLLVLFLWRSAVFRPWHRFTRLVDIARPALFRLIAILGAGLGEGVRPGAAEEGLRFLAEGHIDRYWVCWRRASLLLVQCRNCSLELPMLLLSSPAHETSRALRSD